MDTKQKLIDEIWNHCESTHNESDYEDLKTFSIELLKEILTDIKTLSYV